MTETKIEYRDPAELRLHKLQRQIPEPDKGSPEWAAFKINLAEAGPEGIPPLFITKDGAIMDGGWRWRGAKELQWDKLPCIVRPEEQAGAIIVDTLLHRKQMTRGAAIYIALGVMKEFIEAAEFRRLANLKQGKKSLAATLKPQDPSNSEPSTFKELCERWGISWDTFDRARKVRALLHDPACAALAEMFAKTRSKTPSNADLAELQIKLRKEFEPQLLNGEKNLWNVVSGIAGALPGNQTHRSEGVQTAQLELFTDGFATLRDNAPKAWKRLGDDKRASVLDAWRETVKVLPPELRTEMAKILTQEGN